MSWTYEPAFDAAHRAALSDGKNLIYVCPPAAWAIEPLFGRLSTDERPGVGTLVLVPNTSDGLDVAAVTAARDLLQPAHPTTGLARTARLLQADAIRTLIATPSDSLELVKRSILKLTGVTRVAVLWPELQLAADPAVPIDTLLGDCPDAQRLVITTDPSSVRDFVERHARRAPIVTAAQLPDDPIGPARYALVDRARIPWAVRATLDILNPQSAVVWDPVPSAHSRWVELLSDPTVRLVGDPGAKRADLAVAVDLPSAEAFRALGATATEVVVLPRPAQLSYLSRLAHPLSILRLSGEADRARDRGLQLRVALRGQIDAATGSGDLLTLAPLFDEYDPALVAAAALELGGAGREADYRGSENLPTWVRIHINAGKRDRIRTADIVGALLNAVGLPKDHVGRVDVRESYSLVDVRTEQAERALQGLDGLPLRGRRVSARIDRN